MSSSFNRGLNRPAPEPLARSGRLRLFETGRLPAIRPGWELELSPRKSWTLIDTETTSLWAPVHIIEIAAQKFEGLTPVGEPFRVYLNHDIEIPAETTAVHGYTTDFIKTHGIAPREAHAQFRNYAGDNPIASHYLFFDWDRALVPEWARLGEPLIGRRGFCSWTLAGRALPEHPSHNLDYLREIYHLKGGGAHTALGDVEATVDLLLRIVFPRLARLGYSSIEAIAEFSRLTAPVEPSLIVQQIAFENELKKLEQEATARGEDLHHQPFTLDHVLESLERTPHAPSDLLSS